MIKLLQKKIRFFFILLLVGANYCLAQPPLIKTSVSNNNILIGEQFKLKVEAIFAGAEFKVNWLNLPDSLQHFELIEKSKADSIYNNDQLTGVTQSFTLTSFDSGKWNLPVVRVNIDPVKDDTTYNLFSDSMPINVAFSVSDTTTQLRDIKPLYEVSDQWPLWYWIAGGISVLVLIALLVWLFRYWKKNRSVIGVKSTISPFDEAMLQLDALKKYNLSDAADTKLFHSKLVTIFTQYLSGSFNTNHLNKTTGDLLIVLKSMEASVETVSKMAGSLRFADAVKFAKYQPIAGDSENCLQVIKETIILLHKKLSTKPASTQVVIYAY